MTTAEIRAFLALAEKATPGKWYSFMYAKGVRDDRDGTLVAATAPGHQIRSETKSGTYPSSDQDFIAACRESAPALAAEVLRLREAGDALAEAAEDIGCTCPTSDDPIPYPCDGKCEGKILRAALSAYRSARSS